MLQMAKDMLEYEEEEFRQLEKMYKADDATEGDREDRAEAGPRSP